MSVYKDLNNVEAFKCIANDLSLLYEAKNNDYGNSFHDTYARFGIISAATRISDKYNRFCQLAQGVEAKVKDEKIEDTLKDMASYCIMTLIELENGKESDTSESKGSNKT